MSLIATPPVDRLAVRTFIMPFDSVVIREAIQRERFRGGQVFCVVPRIEDMGRIAPVSYTHLDVYKRQHLGWCGNFRLVC